MSKFVYYNNDFSDHGNPEDAIHYYNYLKGIWKDGKRDGLWVSFYDDGSLIKTETYINGVIQK